MALGKRMGTMGTCRHSYVVAVGLRKRQPPVTQFLFRVNDAFNALKASGGGAKKGFGVVEDGLPDILSLLPDDVLRADEVFCEYLRQSNMAIVQEQVDALELLYKYIEDTYVAIEAVGT